MIESDLPSDLTAFPIKHGQCICCFEEYNKLSCGKLCEFCYSSAIPKKFPLTFSFKPKAAIPNGKTISAFYLMRKSDNALIKTNSFGIMERRMESLHRKGRLLKSKKDYTLVTVGYFSAGFKATAELHTYTRVCGIANVAKEKWEIPEMEPYAAIPDYLGLLERIENNSILVMPSPTTFLTTRPSMLNFLLDLEKRLINMSKLHLVYIGLYTVNGQNGRKIKSDVTILAATEMLTGIQAGIKPDENGTPLERVLHEMDNGNSVLYFN